jgi:uncharacterized membrane protein
MTFLRNTLVAGILLLFPFLIVLLVAREAIRALRNVVNPIAKLLPFEALWGVSAENLATLFLIIGICLLAGLFATTVPGRRITALLERRVLQYLPLYGWAMMMLRNLGASTSTVPTEVVMLDTGDGIEQLAWVTERPAPDRVTLYVPDPPNGQSGAVLVVPETKVRAVDLTIPQVLEVLRRLGGGSSALFPTTSSSLPDAERRDPK